MPPPVQLALIPPSLPEPSRDARLRNLATIANVACAETACGVAGRVALAWWNGLVAARGGDPGRLRAPPPPSGLAELPSAAADDAAALGRDLVALSVTDANAWLGRLYTQALPSDRRARDGVFYTPPVLVARLLAQAQTAGPDWTTVRAIDPACGAGAFLVQAGERMLAAVPNADPAISLANVGSRLRGWEIDPFAAWLAQLSVEALLLPQVVASGRRLAQVVEVRDTLTGFAPAAGSWGLVMGNPPFGKVKDTAELRARFRRSLYGHPNLYGLFVDLAVHLAREDGGVVAFLTPASFLAGQYFRNLRRLLHEQAPPATLDLVESRTDVFEDVLQEVLLSTFRRGPPAAVTPCSVIHVTPAGLRIDGVGPFLLPPHPEEPWLLPRCPADAALVNRLRDMPTRLADWGYEVCTGPLVWNRHKPKLRDEPKPGCVPVVWAEAVAPDGRFALRASKRNHRVWFEPRGPDDPNLVDRPCVLVQRTTAKEQSRRLIAAEMPASLFRQHKAVAVENHLNMVRQLNRRPKVPLRLVSAFLATEIADRILRCMNASVAVSASELESMPLPKPEEILLAEQQPDFERAMRRLYGVAA